MNFKKITDTRFNKGSQIFKENKIIKGEKDKMKVAELIAEVELLEEKQILETEARKLQIKEELAKAKARFSV